MDIRILLDVHLKVVLPYLEDIIGRGAKSNGGIL
jgi:hypothetical protein